MFIIHILIISPVIVNIATNVACGGFCQNLYRHSLLLSKSTVIPTATIRHFDRKNQQATNFGVTVNLFKAHFFTDRDCMCACLEHKRFTFIYVCVCVSVYNTITYQTPNEKTIKKIIFGVGRFDNFIAFLRHHDSVIFTRFGFSIGCLNMFV